jgi:hypothetical protein
MPKSCIIALGPTSTILNALPLAHQMNAEGNRPCFAIADEFKSILESVTYVDPIVVPGSYENLRTTMDSLAKQYSVVQMQVKGHGYMIPKPMGQSWSEEAYQISKNGSRFCDGQFEALCLDRRFPDEEAAIVDALIGDDPRPIILVNLTNPTHAQFTFANQVMELVASRFSEECRIIDLQGMKARLGSLLGLFERASFLITADNATLHLAAACPTLPYIAFIADKPSLWDGSYTRGNCVLRIRYGQYTFWPLTITKLIEKAVFRAKYPLRLVHAFHIPPNVGYDSWRRNTNAQRTWKAAKVLGWIEDVGLRLEDLPRRFNDGDREMAYVKDMIDAAYKKCDPNSNDAIMLCNSDTCFSTDMYDQIVKIFDSGVEGFCGPRRDFQRLTEALEPAQIHGGVDYCGTDLFVFRPKWWEKNRDAFPDMVLGGEAWDCIMRWQMLYRDKMPFVRDLIYHERHASRWEQRDNINQLPMQKHNITLAIKALEELNAWGKEHGQEKLWSPGMFGIHPARLHLPQRPTYPHQQNGPRPMRPPFPQHAPGPRQVVHPAVRPK